MTQRDAAHFGERAFLAIAVLLLSTAVAHGSTYYVRTDGNDGNDGLTNTSAEAWRTIDWAARHVAAGDVVRVQAGTYAERVTPGASGIAENPITFVADGAVTFCGMDITSKNYLRVIGFTIDTDAATCTKDNLAVRVSGTNASLEFWNNIIRDARYAGIGAGSYADRHHNFLVIGNRFTAIGGGGSNGSAVSLRGNNSVFAYNEVTAVDPDAFQVDGTYNRWLNNYIHNVVDTFDLHSDVFQSNSSTLGVSYNLLEANLALGNGTLPNEHFTLIQNQTSGVNGQCENGPCGAVTENLFRHNVWRNSGGFGANDAQAGNINNIRLIHNTIVDALRYHNSHGSRQPYSAWWGGSGPKAVNGYIYNTLFYNGWTEDLLSSGIQAYYTDTGTISGANYNLAYTPENIPTYAAPWTSQASPRNNVNPSFVDVASDSFDLRAPSAGGPLTTVSGSGTGTTFTVALGGGGFFRGPNTSVKQYNGRLTTGDTITVGNTIRTVASVAGDVVSVTQPFTWVHGDPVYLGTAATFDVGAYPYKPGGYLLTATYMLSGGTVTVIPSDPSLVRFAVCYEDGIPTTVDNASPYTCSVGTGSLSVRVYPLYASKILSVPAAMVTSGPSAPTNLRIAGR